LLLKLPGPFLFIFLPLNQPNAEGENQKRREYANLYQNIDHLNSRQSVVMLCRLTRYVKTDLLRQPRFMHLSASWKNFIPTTPINRERAPINRERASINRERAPINREQAPIVIASRPPRPRQPRK
jgi:hypothetical protein